MIQRTVIDHLLEIILAAKEKTKEAGVSTKGTTK